MNKITLSIGLEFLWWIFTAIVVAAVLYPIVSVVENYEFLVPNILFIVILITCVRYIFLLKHTFLAKLQFVKVVLVFASIYATILLIDQISKFHSFYDNYGLEGLIGDALPQEEAVGLVNYIRNEMLFFGVGAIIAVLALAYRLLASVWRLKNRGVV